MTVVPSMCNRLNNLHGRAQALIYDMCTTMAIAPIAREDFWCFGGVSRVLSVTYLRPAKVNYEVVIECEVVQIGTRLGARQPSFCWRLQMFVARTAVLISITYGALGPLSAAHGRLSGRSAPPRYHVIA